MTKGIMKGALILVVVCSLLLILYIKDVRKKDKFLEKSQLGSGVIVSTNFANKTGCYVQYTFSNEGVSYSGETRSNLPYHNSNIIIGKFFPVLYTKMNPAENTILITPESFKYYNLEFPDSLNWIIAYQ